MKSKLAEAMVTVLSFLEKVLRYVFVGIAGVVFFCCVVVSFSWWMADTPWKDFFYAMIDCVVGLSILGLSIGCVFSLVFVALGFAGDFEDTHSNDMFISKRRTRQGPPWRRNWKGELE